MKRHKENTVIMGDLNPFSFSTFDYLTPLFKYQNDPKKLDAAVRDGDPEALMWKRAPASMNANGGRTRIGGSIATGARSATPTAPTPAPRPKVGASLPPSSDAASVHADAPVESLPVDQNAGSQTPGFMQQSKSLGGAGFPPAAG